MKQQCWVPSISLRRVYFRMFLNFAVTFAALLLLITFFPQLGSLNHFYDAVWLIVILTGIQIILWPLLIQIFLGLFHKISAEVLLLVFPLVFLLLPAFLIIFAGWLSPGLTINGFGAALLIGLIMAVISLIFSSLYSSDDEVAIFRWILKRNRAAAAVDNPRPGIIFLEIDGLSGRVLHEVMEMGKAPNMKRWLDCGSHKIVTWETDLSSQTSAAQAGILHGNNFGIPGFRWYDKARREIIVSSSIKDVSELEKQLSNGDGLLSPGGAARSCLFSGDASRVLMTASRVLDMTTADVRAYYLNPSNMLKTSSLMVWDWFLEKKAAWSQKLRNERPRINRGGIYFILRSCMTILLRDFSIFALKGDMYSGLPYAYATFAGYDEVSHHSGTMRRDTLEVLRKLDKEFGKLEKIARDAPRKYYLVVLSDHGHTQGTTFSDRYKERLEEVVSRLIHSPDKEYHITGYRTYHESAYYLDAAFQSSKFSRSSTGQRLRNSLLRNQQVLVGKGEKDDVIVLASGNMGLIYFPNIPHRVTLKEITQQFPGLISGLVSHPGIGFISVRTETGSATVLGKEGEVSLSNGHVKGKNPLTDYGPALAANLARADNFPNAPDILVMSTYWKDRDEVAAFEELVSSHGGAGGAQTQPFILYPSGFELGTDKIIGSETIYHIFKRWTREVT
jgi:putative membrane protein